jgi:hypothetical protein
LANYKAFSFLNNASINQFLKIVSVVSLDFKVKWKALWLHLSIYTSIAITAGIAIVVFIDAAKKDFDYELIFKHVSPIGLAGIIIGACAIVSIFMLLIALVCSLAKVRIENDEICGRNYWGFRKRFPLTDIESLSSFNNNGIECIVVRSRKQEKIYILKQTENIEDLMALLATYIEEEKNHSLKSYTL